MKKKEKKPLFFDNELFQNSLNFLERTCQTWNAIAEVWNDQKILPEFSYKHFQQLLSNPDYLTNQFCEAAKSKLDSWLADRLSPESFEPKLPENWRFLHAAAKGDAPSRLRIIEDVSLIEFKAGIAVVSDEAKRTLKDRCSLPETPENIHKMQTVQAFCDAHNNFANLLGELFKAPVHPKGDYLETRLFEYTDFNKIAPKFGTLLTL